MKEKREVREAHSGGSVVRGGGGAVTIQGDEI